MVGLIWAQSSSGVIGRGGTLPWHLPEDLAHFKEITHGHTVVMGRRTWESLPERNRPLPGRRNIVLSRAPGYAAPGAEVVADLDAALAAEEDIWVIGGGEVYAQALPRATRCEVTEVEIDLRREEGDALAPVLDESWVGTVGPWRTSRTGLRYRYHSYRRA
ncbi:dihydrofolate reductase [uncultured Mycolicibacterium sp.]|uniref:dihydrofolate reductase n=1 Tax=uncultured Mycolicibacterium sp. TaxID=2320817 RepID=UPI0026338E8F|nr:dihydrofolate reductase [uncultured Mycolicibacterium sp.]